MITASHKRLNEAMKAAGVTFGQRIKALEEYRRLEAEWFGKQAFDAILMNSHTFESIKPIAPVHMKRMEEDFKHITETMADSTRYGGFQVMKMPKDIGTIHIRR